MTVEVTNLKHYQMDAFQNNDNGSLWLILSIVFILLFAISFAANIFLWIVRRRDLVKLKEELQRQYDAHLQDSQASIFYGGVKSTYL